MARNLVPRVPILLALTELDDQGLHELAGSIGAAAPTSKLVANDPAMATSAAAIGATNATLLAANTAVANDKAKLHLDIAAEALARTLLIGKIRSYATCATNDAKVPADIQGAGLVPRDTSVPKLPPAPPPSLDTKTPVKGHGKIVVSAHETGPTRQSYVAQSSSDGITWAQLGLGRGKTRTITGATGTKVWVRMATVRGEQQSDWCTPVLVTIP